MGVLKMPKTVLNDEQRLIVEENKALSYDFVYKHFYYLSNEVKEDLIQEGILGMCRAVQLYDGEIAEFSTYATTWIKSYVYRYLQYKESKFKVTKESMADARKEDLLSFDAPILFLDSEGSLIDIVPDKDDLIAKFENDYNTEMEIKEIFSCITKEEYNFLLDYIKNGNKKGKDSWKNYRKFENLSRKVRMCNRNYRR